MAAEVLLGDDVRGVQRPADGELDLALLEGHRAVPVVRDAGVAPLPRELVVGMDPLGGEVAADADAGADVLRSQCHVDASQANSRRSSGRARNVFNHNILWSLPAGTRDEGQITAR